MQQSSMRTLSAILLSVVLVIGFAVIVKVAFRGYDAFTEARATEKLYKVHPAPEHTPADVVRFQMSALSQVDRPHPGAGIELVYSFLSPDQRETLENLDQLAELFTKAPYKDLLGFTSAKLDNTRIAGDHAQQLVLIHTQDNRLVAFVFILNRQQDGEYAGSWMTGAVLPVQLQMSAQNLPVPQPEPAVALPPTPAE